MTWKRGAMLLAAGIATAPIARQAQAQPAPRRLWAVNGEIGASVFFGASSQTAILTRARIERKDERLEYTTSGSFEYGQASDPDRGSWVNKRSWATEMSLDYAPQSRWSPFIYGSLGGSLQKKIDLRAAGGLGGKYRFVQTDRTRVDASLAMLAERTDPRVAAGQTQEIKRIGRWSSRFRGRQTFAGDRAAAELVIFYRPRVDDTSDHTIDIDASTSYALTSIVALKLSLVDRFDSLARSRGARSNNDGRLFVTLSANLR